MNPPKKKYLQQKLGGAAIMFWLLVGFLFGSTAGQALFIRPNNDVIKFTMVYSSEKASWISETSSLFMEFWTQKMEEDPTLKPITLDFQAYGSGDMLIALLNGEIKPVIWSPASNIWVPLLNAKWSQYKQTNDQIVQNFTRLIYSPVVITTWEDFYTEHPFNGIRDLQQLIVDNPGLIKMAHTDPRASNSGFMATVMLVSAYLDMDPQEITLEDIYRSDLYAWMTDFESAAVAYGKSTGFLGKYMLEHGPDSLQISILYENLVQDFSASAEERYGQKLIAVYPEEGALFSDHPFCILNAEWVSADQAMVAQEYLQFLSQMDLIKRAIATGFRPIDSNLLLNPEIAQIYEAAFNAEHGVTADPSIIIEALPPADGTVIARIPDLWLKTRNNA